MRIRRTSGLLCVILGLVQTTTQATVPGLQCPARTGNEIQWPSCPETRWGSLDRNYGDEGDISNEKAQAVISSSSATASRRDESEILPDGELDTDSPLDNAKFLSFEDWKKQNLAKAGQSAENVRGHGRAVGQERRRPPAGINNALDSLGDDTEIEIDFVGFGGGEGPDPANPSAWGAQVFGAQSSDAPESLQHGVPRAGASRRKDAGTTCKERFNYASFDCAATVLKTNPECKGSSSVLIENKDSYMLNECRAENKFLILELCDDILVDTVVLANYEFFSSIFHTFRVSVADRYPAKLDQWKELGVYDARNTREVQAFAVENPLIWARYLKIEFLTHYGSEFYCPISLIRVHGTTMMEEFKNDGDASRAEDDLGEETLVPHPIAVDSKGDPVDRQDQNQESERINTSLRSDEACPLDPTEVERALIERLPEATNETCSIEERPKSGPAGQASGSVGNEAESSTRPGAASAAVGDQSTQRQGATEHPNAVRPSSTGSADTVTTKQNSIVSDSDSRSTPVSKEEQQQQQQYASTNTQPPSANPTTQESFFKLVNKRLQTLESNSTLSLQYIEEQSRILRDAFSKVEKRQLAKTSTFLENLNVTVLNELKQFREQYDQVWKSVAVELEHQRFQYHQEIHSLSAQLGVLADELVFQKRVAVIQSIMVLFCFGLVLFNRGAGSSSIEFPIVQNMVSRSYSLRSSSPFFGSPSAKDTRGHRRHRRVLSEDSADGRLSPMIAYSPPTPSSGGQSSASGLTSSPEVLHIPSLDTPLYRPQSSPPVLPGCDVVDVQGPPSPRSMDSSADKAISSMDYHRKVLQGKLDGASAQAAYVSPSDDIMSPCTKKLSDLKGKRFKKYFFPLSPYILINIKTMLTNQCWKTAVQEFVETDCIPADTVFEAQLGEGDKRWTTTPAVLEELKAKARRLGLWNLFLPRNHFTQGAGFSNLEYGLMAEYLGKSKVAQEATNCSAPDTGNMEVLAKYGTEAQKKEWLTPLLEGQIRSAFLMTEPEIASSDATNIQLDIRREGNQYVLNGSKWWSSGAGDPRCAIYVVMGKTDASHKDPYRQQSVVLVPANTPGITVHRMLSVYGYDDAPHGHAHISFKDVRVPVANMVLGEGRGFEIIQGRLGPGRIHHAMRAIGAAEKAVDWLIARVNDERKTTFGQKLASHGVILEWIAKSRIEIDAARLIVLNAAAKIDAGNAKSAMKEIAQAKVLVPQTALAVIDRAVQAYGAAGVCQDTPLAYLWAQVRTLRIADGPDEVHLQQLGRRENKTRKDELMAKIRWQREEGDRLLAAAGLAARKSHL
ncbi:hypothetical protein ASPZODRAFT_60310 [Penicilliopsis zonata CBS 506.65]|uniref:SUN domain-containing protein n=1 Tax=Penicilliopsis zonata CBS 506.65 TaxID=1073090 RepID=A0A1L9SNR0_9EURO|nr:hypothetical protein ASPZODRAFT_60310 [Penicilliopsis zonata CBS 506.65]OJJ48865.1 hypothetical protein ASPZODRAFT_60310 [Penicilliopsis zonata CBS 506.65]